jgi:hypothetical protein
VPTSSLIRSATLYVRRAELTSTGDIDWGRANVRISVFRCPTGVTSQP